MINLLMRYSGASGVLNQHCYTKLKASVGWLEVEGEIFMQFCPAASKSIKNSFFLNPILV